MKNAGYVWAPYIPKILTPNILKPEDFENMKKGIQTKYGKKVIYQDVPMHPHIEQMEMFK